jgi:2-dehydropantoate 2-reductase
MRVLVLGTGGVGVVFGEYLSRNQDVDVYAVGRSNYEALSGEGVRIVTNSGHDRTFKPKQAFNQEQLENYEGEPFDFIIVCTKATAGASVSLISRCIGPDTIIFITQNGVDVEEPYLREYPGVAVASAVLRVAAAIKSTSEVYHYQPKLDVEGGIVYPAVSTCSLTCRGFDGARPI